VNTTLAATPLRRATSVTFAPGANVSSTIRLVILRPAPTPLQPAQNLDPHRLMTLKLDLRSHASRITTRHTRRRSSDAYVKRLDDVEDDVADLQSSRGYMYGAIAVLTLILLPAVGWIFYDYINFKSTNDGHIIKVITNTVQTAALINH
jgi:hypothetical protein